MEGYGKVLFRDALRRALAGADAIGARAFRVHAKDEEARKNALATNCSSSRCGICSMVSSNCFFSI